MEIVQKLDSASALGHKTEELAVHCQACADAVHAGAFPDAAFLIGDGNDLCFRHFGFLLLYQIRRSRR